MRMFMGNAVLFTLTAVLLGCGGDPPSMKNYQERDDVKVKTELKVKGSRGKPMPFEGPGGKAPPLPSRG